MKWFLNENKKWKNCWYLFNSSLIIFDSLNILPSLLLGYMIDEGLQNQNFKLVIGLGIFLIIFSILRGFSPYISVIFLDNTSQMQ